jgi:hypothetical protein
MPMATVMCMPNVRPFPALQPPNLTYTRSVIVRNADHASPIWTSAHPANTRPTSKNWAIWVPSQRNGGTYTYYRRRCIADDGHRTIPTAAIVPIQPALNLPLCALLIAHRQDERVLIPSPLSIVKHFWHLVLSQAHQGAEAYGRHGSAACCRWEGVSPLRPSTALRCPHK